jgi:hypothetical protein
VRVNSSTKTFSGREIGDGRSVDNGNHVRVQTSVCTATQTQYWRTESREAATDMKYRSYIRAKRQALQRVPTRNGGRLR